MTDGVVLLVAGALLLVSAPLLQWQVAQASTRVVPDWRVPRRWALAGVLVAALAALGAIAGGLLELL